uniref:Uncharacterized protein n=1 Tax=Oryza punctata TaxID=4537 RepID=A0A0E0KM65_ORYPU
MLRKPQGDGEPCFGNTRCYSTIGIYGVGGSGKTTLHNMYNLPGDAHSSKPSDEYSSLSLETLQTRLKEELKGKRFLLLLDDISAEKNVVSMQDRLDQLVSPLREGKVGSKVLFTTRFKDVAMSLGAQDLFPVPEFNKEDFFNLFMHYALDDGVNLNDQERETLHSIGRDIVKKLKGSPLAARIVGARLRKQLNATVWTRVGDQHLLTDTMGALWWSYQHLNVQTTDSAEQMEVVCQSYFNELLSCSFLQPKDVYGSKNKWFTMHDLLHELDVMVSGNIAFKSKVVT